MKNAILIASLLLSGSVFAEYSRTVEVYNVVGVEAVNSKSDGWATLETATGLYVFVRCSDGSFDDAVHDRVGGFENTKECLEFLSELTKKASVAKPIGIQIGPRILIHKEMRP